MKTHLGFQKFGSIIKLPLGTIGIGMVRPNTPSVLTPIKLKMELDWPVIPINLGKYMKWKNIGMKNVSILTISNKFQQS